MDSNARGRELESAVHAIEAVILEASPALREKPFVIESRKRGRSGEGVHIDLHL